MIKIFSNRFPRTPLLQSESLEQQRLIVYNVPVSVLSSYFHKEFGYKMPKKGRIFGRTLRINTLMLHQLVLAHFELLREYVQWWRSDQEGFFVPLL